MSELPFKLPHIKRSLQILPLNIVLVADGGGRVDRHVYLPHFSTFFLSVHECVTNPTYGFMIPD